MTDDTARAEHCAGCTGTDYLGRPCRGCQKAHHAARLRTAFGYAVRKRLIDHNPAADLDLPRIPRTERVPLTGEQLKQLLEFTNGAQDRQQARPVDGDVPPRLQGRLRLASVAVSADHALIVTAAMTGMRHRSVDNLYGRNGGPTSVRHRRDALEKLQEAIG